MDENQQKKEFSGAWLRAIAAVAGFAVSEPSVDDDSIDFSIGARGDAATPRRPRVELQLKCTSQDVRRPDGVHFQLDKKKNYDDLRDDRVLVPRILIVVLVPEDVGHWLAQTEDQMVLKRCGYWMSLAGMAERPDVDKVTVVLPSSQVLTPDGLKEIMRRIDQGVAL